MKNALKSSVQFFVAGKRMLSDQRYKYGREINYLEGLKNPSRTEVINFLLDRKNGKTRYLEIGVRNPDHNFNKIVADEKYSVDPGLEFKHNPADFKMTSDVFFESLTRGEVLFSEIQFDVVFIDGLHLAEQVDRDIINAMKFIKDDGFVVLHDCNPPTEWHARENYEDYNTPAGGCWNGTTWKAFLKWRFNKLVNSCCIDSDWGVGILSKTRQVGKSIDLSNPFFEYNEFAKNRKSYLNLVNYDEFKKLID